MNSCTYLDIEEVFIIGINIKPEYFRKFLAELQKQQNANFFKKPVSEENKSNDRISNQNNVEMDCNKTVSEKKMYQSRQKIIYMIYMKFL